MIGIQINFTTSNIIFSELKRISIFLSMDKNLKKIVVIGDRVLLKPVTESNITGGGLYLPPSVKDSHAVHTGVVMKIGPGYPIPIPHEPDQFLTENYETVNYIPLQVHEGDQALYLHSAGTEIEVNHERYVIVPQNAILLVFREDFSDLENL